MGYFSFKTADTGFSIMNVASGHCRPVYMLNPNGAPIFEPLYLGYGDFGGISAFKFLAMMNAESLGYKNDHPDLELIGQFLFYGTVRYNLKEGCLVCYDELYKDAVKAIHRVKYIEADEATKSERFLYESELSFYKLIKYPLKFSFNKDAVYSKLMASDECRRQGYYS